VTKQITRELARDEAELAELEQQVDQVEEQVEEVEAGVEELTAVDLRVLAMLEDITRRLDALERRGA
jgi:hypothetical protein